MRPYAPRAGVPGGIHAHSHSEFFLVEYPGRVVNIHPALLPSFPGLHAQSQALEYGVKITGCTVHLVDEGVDTGPIIMQRAVEVLRRTPKNRCRPAF